MMKKKVLIALALFFLIGIEVSGQDRVVVKAGEDISSSITSKYLFPDFTTARVLLGNETVVAKMNYNALSGEMEFTDPVGQILSLQSNARVVIFEDHFFKRTPKGFMEVLANNHDAELLVYRRYRAGEVKKVGAYGTVSSTSAIDNYSSVTTDVGQTSLTLAQHVTYSKTFTYYIFDGSKYRIANKQTFSKIFGKQKIERYLKESPVTFSNEDELLRLFRYCSE